MIAINKAYNMGMTACEEKLGNLFTNNKKRCSRSYGETPEGYFCYIGVDTDDVNNDVKLTSDGFPFFASCFVDMHTGDISWAKCVLPEGAFKSSTK